MGSIQCSLHYSVIALPWRQSPAGSKQRGDLPTLACLARWLVSRSSRRCARSSLARKGSTLAVPLLAPLHPFHSLKSLQRISSQGKDMSEWLHSLPVLWMSVLVFGFTYLVTAGIYAVITVFAVGERARSFKTISPGLLPPLGIIFGLFVVFTAAQVWTDNEKAKAEIDREASALRSAEILVTSFPTETQVQLRELVRRYIADVVAQEWPLMAQGTANLRAIPGVLAEALQATLALNPSSEGQKTAQRHIATALETALDARRQRIIISESQVNLVKWACLFMQALCALVAIAMVHSDNRLASIIAMGIFATGVAASIFLILVHDRPFIGELSIKPDPLLQVMPEIASSR